MGEPAFLAVPHGNTLKFLQMTSDIIFPYKIMIKSRYNKFLIASVYFHVVSMWYFHLCHLSHKWHKLNNDDNSVETTVNA